MNNCYCCFNVFYIYYKYSWHCIILIFKCYNNSFGVIVFSLRRVVFSNVPNYNTLLPGSLTLVWHAYFSYTFLPTPKSKLFDTTRNRLSRCFFINVWTSWNKQNMFATTLQQWKSYYNNIVKNWRWIFIFNVSFIITIIGYNMIYFLIILIRPVIWYLL